MRWDQEFDLFAVPMMAIMLTLQACPPSTPPSPPTPDASDGGTDCPAACARMLSLGCELSDDPACVARMSHWETAKITQLVDGGAATCADVARAQSQLDLAAVRVHCGMGR